LRKLERRHPRLLPTVSPNAATPLWFSLTQNPT